MKLVQTIKELQSELDALRSEGKTIGLVPTMGALHAGHASLVKRAVAENDVVVVSDFVNPTQFNDKNDLAKYPRTLDADCELLEKVEDSDQYYINVVMQDKLAIDLEYIRNVSFGYDIRLVFQTFLGDYS